MEANVWALFAIGLAAGFVGSLLGLGGGFFVIPLLTLALGLPIQVAFGTSIVGVVATSGMASITYLKQRLANVRLALVLESVTTVGAVGGAILMSYFSQQVLGAVFGSVMIYVAYNMARQKAGIQPRPPGDTTAPDPLDAAFYDRSQDRVIHYRVRRLPYGMAASVFAGLISGLLGVGGGVIKVPVMNLIMSIPVKAAIATSTFTLGITATASVFIYYFRGFIHPGVAAPVVIGIAAGALAGARVAWRASGHSLRIVFAGILGVMALLMFLKALGIGLTG